MTVPIDAQDESATPSEVGAPEISVLRGDPAPEEIAAIVAVLTEVAREVSAADAVAAQAGPGGWERSTRRLRAPLNPGPGAWTGFSA